MNKASNDSLIGDMVHLVEQVRDEGCHVHSITNTVAQNFTANVLLACGATVSMTANPDEIDAFMERAQTLHVNLGTLDETRVRAIHLAIAKAQTRHIPITLDPVMVHLSPIRKGLALEIANKCTVLKANTHEYEALSAALSNDVCVIETGAVDEITYKDQRLRIDNGSSMLATTIATGCALGALIAAFSTKTDDVMLASASALLVYSIAGELAAENSSGPGSFVPAFLDALHTVSPQTLITRAKLS